MRQSRLSAQVGPKMRTYLNGRPSTPKYLPNRLHKDDDTISNMCRDVFVQQVWEAKSCNFLSFGLGRPLSMPTCNTCTPCNPTTSAPCLIHNGLVPPVFVQCVPPLPLQPIPFLLQKPV